MLCSRYDSDHLRKLHFYTANAGKNRNAGNLCQSRRIEEMHRFVMRFRNASGCAIHRIK